MIVLLFNNEICLYIILRSSMLLVRNIDNGWDGSQTVIYFYINMCQTYKNLVSWVWEMR